MSKKLKTSTSEDIEILKHLPLVLTFKIIQNKDCKFIIRTLSESKRQIKRLEITKAQFEKLTERITSKAFDKLTKKVADHVKDEGTYSLKPWPEIKKFVLDAEIEQAANKFYTKCLFKYLYDKYEGDTMKKKWYDAIKKKNKLDLKNFGYFTNVTNIGESAFAYNNLTSVTIPNSVTWIGNSAFSSNQLISVEFGDTSSLEHIGHAAFSNNQLTSVRIPDSVTNLGQLAFYRNNLTNVTFGDASSVRSIEYMAFSNNQLTRVTFGAASSLETIRNFAFSNNKIKSVRIPDSVTWIGRSAFSDNQLTSVRIPASVTEYADAFDPNVDIIREGVAITESSNSLQLKF